MSKFYTIKKIEAEIENIKRDMAPFVDEEYFKKSVEDNKTLMLVECFSKRTSDLNDMVKQSIKCIENDDFDIYIQNPEQYLKNLTNLSIIAANLSSASALINEYKNALKKNKTCENFSSLSKIKPDIKDDEKQKSTKHQTATETNQQNGNKQKNTQETKQQVADQQIVKEKAKETVTQNKNEDKFIFDPNEINDKTQIEFAVNDDLIVNTSLIKKLVNNLKYGVASVVKSENAKVFKDKALMLCTNVDEYVKKNGEIALHNYADLLKKLNKALTLLEKSKVEYLINSCKENIKFLKTCYRKKLYKQAYIENAEGNEKFNKKEYSQAYNLFKQALAKYTQLGDDNRIKLTTKNVNVSYYNWQTESANNLLDLAKFNADKDNFDSAFKNLNQAYKIFDEINNKNGIELYKKQKEYIQQKKQEMIEMENRLGCKNKNKANEYFKNGNYDMARIYYNFAADNFRKAENYSAEETCKNDIDDCYYEEGNDYLDLANSYAAKGDFNAAKAYFDQAEKIYSMGSKYKGVNNCREQKERAFKNHGDELYDDGVDEFNRGNYNSAIDYFKSAIYYYEIAYSYSDVSSCKDWIYNAEQEIKRLEQIKKENEEAERLNEGIDYYNRGVELMESGDYAGARSAFICAENRGVDSYDCREAIEECDEELDA